MMSKNVRNLLMLFVSGFFALPSLATPESEYDCSFKLSDGLQSMRKVTLSKDVYRCLKFDNFADIAVVNADQQIVPFTISSRATKEEQKEYQKNITFFKEPEASAYRTGDQIRRIAALTGVVSHRIDDQQWQNTNVHYSSVILKQPPLTNDQYGDDLLSLALDVDTKAVPIRATVIVEVSDDLQNWKTLSKPHNLYFLPGNVSELNSNSLVLSSYPDRSAKYLRLAMLSNVQNFSDQLKNIRGVYLHTESRPPAMQWLTVQPYMVDGEDGVWEFELPALFPVSALRFTNADNIVYYQGTLFSESHENPKSDDGKKRKSGKKKLKAILKGKATVKRQSSKDLRLWRNVTSFNQYKLIVENGSIESPDVRFSNVKSRLWKVEFNAPSNLIESQLPKIELGWKPLQLNFVAQGRGPFMLLAGRESATKKVVFPARLQSLSKTAETVQLLKTVKSTEELVDLPETVEPTKDNRMQILLWLLLLAGAGMMSYMVYQLTRKKEA